MRIECSLCNKHIGAISNYVKLKDGNICEDCLKNVGLSPTLACRPGYYKELDTATVSSFKNVAEMILSKKDMRNEYFKQWDELAKKFEATKVIPEILEIDANNKIVKLLSVIKWSDFRHYEWKTHYFKFDQIKSVKCLEEKNTYRSEDGKVKYKYCSNMYIRIETTMLEEPIQLTINVHSKPILDSSEYNELKIQQENIKELLEEVVIGKKKKSDSSAADEIRKFKGLLDDGIITQEEFDAKKKQLLGL